MERFTRKTDGYLQSVEINYFPREGGKVFEMWNKLGAYEDAEEQGLLKWDFHAAWQVDKSIWETMGKDNFVCSHCQTVWASREISNMHYCPTCGAKMDLKESLEQALKEGAV
ncbi:MAG: hypothetical protein IJ471_01390 [Eubacterium sp.]|nr:hypothetical protein [Eubacterium sp.]